MEHTPVYYADYLQLNKILSAQEPVSFSGPEHAHDEMLFVIIHQAYELWFKQILFELEAVNSTLSQPALNDNSPELQTVVHRLKRIVTILKVLVQQIDIMETMTPMDFLDFRDMLRPASGFQSFQFKIIEARLGLEFEQRHGQNYYTSQLRKEDIDVIKIAEEKPSLIQLVNTWLERFPFFLREEYWTSFEAGVGKGNLHPFWNAYRHVYVSSLSEAEKNNAPAFDAIFFPEEHKERKISPAASRSALFIMCYRGYPMLELPFQLLDTLLEIDNELGNWRFRHINMIRRMIGSRIGTGGSTGAGYLQGAMDKHFIFKEFSQLNSFLVNRRKLPQLPHEVIEKLGYQ